MPEQFKFSIKNIQGTNVRVLVCLPLLKAGFENGFSTRSGGVSFGEKRALNLSYKSDIRKSVDTNRQRFLTFFSRSQPLVLLNQTHSDTIHAVNVPGKFENEKIEGDALVTNQNRVLLGVKTADCLPLLLADPITRVVAAIHSGWKGTLQNIAGKAIQFMQQHYAVKPKNLLAAIGPSACVSCYEVGDEVVRDFEAQKELVYGVFHRKKSWTKPHFNNVATVRYALREAGVLNKQIYVSPHCTIHDEKYFFSHRRESKNANQSVGRQLAVISSCRRKLS